MSLPRILLFHDIQKGDPVGGKAEGLSRLIQMGLHVPPGFVILDAQAGHYPADLDQHYQALGGGKVAVRSSAVGEDSSGASFAGQYETILDVEGINALRHAIDHCLASLQTARASAYRHEKAGGDHTPMAIVVQEMVDACCAGVLFTADPVNHRRDHLVIDAVPGNGQKLVNGEVTPDHHLYDRIQGKLAKSELAGAHSVLNPDHLKMLVSDSEKAEKLAGQPLDMEWAIDRAGRVCWLQARPITTLAADLNELDSPLIAPDHIFTKCNVAEALPGALCPLTHSVSGRALDIGMQRMFIEDGLIEKEDPRNLVFGSFYGHLFINMTTMAWTPRQILGLSADDLSLAICGRLIPELDQQIAKAPLLKRIPRIIKHLRLTLSADKKRDELQRLARQLELPEKSNALEQWQIIDNHLETINRAFFIHYVSSMGAGTMAPLLLGILAKGKEPTPEHHSLVAALLAGADNVESANIAKGANEIVHLLLEQPRVKEKFVNASTADAFTYLNSADSGPAGQAFVHYLERHGHRSISEMDIRAKDWACNPMPLVESLQTSIRALQLQQEKTGGTAQHKAMVDHRLLPRELPFIIRKLIPIAHNAVRGREFSKSLLVKVLQKFKIAYRHLAQLMLEAGMLNDLDEIYFFTHQELGQYIRKHDPLMLAQADARRKAFAIQKTLVFPDVFTGIPLPVKPDLSRIPRDKLVAGKTVSRGFAIGHAKVAHTIEEASKLQAGDILIAPITDVAWTPYFALIGGLVTDIGSAVSHGAVVAREYGLPAIVKTDIGTRTFQDGDCVVLDANEGYIRMATPEEKARYLSRQDVLSS